MGVLDVIKSNNMTIDPNNVDIEKVKLILKGLSKEEVDQLVNNANAATDKIKALGKEIQLLIDLGKLAVKGILTLA